MAEVDMLQHSDVILLWNIVALFVLSTCTDYWQYRTYRFYELQEKLRETNRSFVASWDYQQWQGLLSIQFHTYDECEEADQFSLALAATTNHNFTGQDDSMLYVHSAIHRKRLSDLYGKPFGKCHCYIFHNDATLSKDSRYDGILYIAFGSACIAGLFACCSLICGTCGALRHSAILLALCATALVGMDICLLITIAAFFIRFQSLKNKSSPLRQDFVYPQEWLAESYKDYSLGWSFASAVICIVLAVIGAYIFVGNANSIRLREKVNERRWKLQQVMLNSCRDEIAVAIRAQMVIEE